MTDVEISSTARSQWRTSLRKAVVVAGPVVTVLLCTVLPSARPAGAQTVAQATAALQGDQAKLDALDQQYLLAQQQLSAVGSQIDQVRSTIAQDQAQMVTDQGALRSEALQMYETGVDDSGLNAVFGQSGEQAAVAHEYSSLAASNMTTAVDALQLAENRLAQQESQLASGQAQAQAATNQIATARADAQTVSNAAQATLTSTKGQMAARPPASLRGAGFGNPPPNGAGGVAVQAAESQIGVPYEWGEESPGHGFDCSGLTQWSWRQAGVSIPRTANDQYQAVARVPLADMEPGDLVFWGSGGYAQHVGIYVGHGDVVDAPESGQDVQIQPIWSSGLMGAGRP